MGADSKYEGVGNLYNITAGEPGRLRSLGRSRRKWKCNININLFLGGIACYGLEWTEFTLHTVVGPPVVGLSWSQHCHTFFYKQLNTVVSVRRNRLYTSKWRGGYWEVVVVAASICAVRLPTVLADIDCLHLWIPSAFIKDWIPIPSFQTSIFTLPPLPWRNLGVSWL